MCTRGHSGISRTTGRWNVYPAILTRRYETIDSILGLWVLLGLGVVAVLGATAWMITSNPNQRLRPWRDVEGLRGKLMLAGVGVLGIVIAVTGLQGNSGLWWLVPAAIVCPILASWAIVGLHNRSISRAAATNKPHPGS